MALDLSKLPTVPLRVITLVVFVMTTWASLGFLWLGGSYLLSNYFVVLLGIWSERDSPSPIPVKCLFIALCFTFLNDILSLAVTYEAPLGRSSTHKFNAAMAIILLLLKPVGALFVFKDLQERMDAHGGGSNYETLGGSAPPANQSGYGGFSDKHENPPMYQPPNQPFP